MSGGASNVFSGVDVGDVANVANGASNVFSGEDVVDVVENLGV